MKDPKIKKYSRNILIFDEVENRLAKAIMSKMINLGTDVQSKDEDIKIFINSPGGSVYDLISIIDSFKLLKCDVETTCVGLAASAAALILACGTKGKRYATVNSRIMIHQIYTSDEGHIQDMEISIEESKVLNDFYLRTMSKQTGLSMTKIKELTDRDKYLSAAEAKKLGIIDHVIA